MEGTTGVDISDLWNPTANRYAVPITPDLQHIRNVRAELEQALSERPAKVVNPIRVAIVDSGLIADHPIVKPFIEEDVDFTGEGPRDAIGHGTLVALTLLVGMITERWITQSVLLTNVKVLHGHAGGDENHLVNGLRWCVGRGFSAVNVSVGVYSKHYGVFSCRGYCRVCATARMIAASGAKVYAAAGNRPNMTSCPARAALATPNSGVISVGASDLPYSGVGTEYTSGTMLLLRV